MFEENDLDGVRVAILATDGFEQSELFEPKAALEKAGAETVVVAPKEGSIKAWNHGDWGKTIEVDVLLEDANPDDFDALLLPGGVISPDKLRINDKAVDFAQAFVDDGKPIAAICHGPQLLIETSIVEGRRMTSWASVKTDLINAGANWVDEEVVTDHGLVTSRKPDDIPAFCRKMIEEFAEGRHESGSPRKDQEQQVPLR